MVVVGVSRASCQHRAGARWGGEQEGQRGQGLTRSKQFEGGLQGWREGAGGGAEGWKGWSAGGGRGGGRGSGTEGGEVAEQGGGYMNRQRVHEQGGEYVWSRSGRCGPPF